MTEHKLDLRALKCPLPSLRTARRLESLPAGEILIVECTDPLAAIDIPNLVRERGDLMEDHCVSAGVLTFRIRRGDRS